jgi:PhoH-like ATPase
MPKITIDTNLLLDDSKIIYKLSKTYDKILVPITVLKELDRHKFNPNLSFSARNAISEINNFKNEFPDKIEFPIIEESLTSNDQYIIEATKNNNAELATKDISMSIIAEANGIKCKTYGTVLNNIFEPYNYININKIYEHVDSFEFGRFYKEDSYNDIVKLFSEILNKELDKNSWFFIFIQTERDEPYIYANNPIKEYLTRLDHHPHYREIKNNSGKMIKAKDIYQICAIYAMREAPHCLIAGRWGSGKSLLSTAYALESDDRQRFISRAPVGISGKYDIGYLPGGLEEKMQDWLAGFTSALYYIYGNTKGQKDGSNGSYDYVKEVIFDRKFQIVPLNAIQGLSLLEDDVLLIDEVQLISVDYMSMILSRPSEGSKLILLGDLKQTYSVVKPSESGLLKLLRALPHRSMAYVKLENSYRSDILELADKLQDKTLE